MQSLCLSIERLPKYTKVLANYVIHPQTLLPKHARNVRRREGQQHRHGSHKTMLAWWRSQVCTWQQQVLDREGVEQGGGQYTPQRIQSQFRQGPRWRKGQGHSDCLTSLQHHSHSVSYSILHKTEPAGITHFPCSFVKLVTILRDFLSVCN